MKKIIALLLALMMVFALAACNNNDDPNGDDPLNRDPGTSQTGNQGGTQGGDEGTLTLEKFNEKLLGMPTSTSKSEIESAVSDVFGVDIALPDGSYSAQPMSAESMVAYVVTISGVGMTANDYYNSIKSTIVAKGYTAVDADLSFYKADGTLAYSIGIESEGNDFYIGFGASAYSGGDIVIPNGNENPDTQDGGIQTGGEVGASAPTSFELPTNVKLVMESKVSTFVSTVTIIKIGNDYYYCSSLNGNTSEKYFKYDSATETWTWYQTAFSDSWYIDEEYQGGKATYNDVLRETFGSTKTANSYANSDPNNGGYSLTSTGRSQKIAGVDTKEYKTDATYNAETFWLTDSGICLGYSGSYATETATEWDTSVTSFGVDLP